mmetsp:Transcript_13902/g.43293  ORF Transcript_13902/g.43293 Transcript_13902/m.43293 type:complete len:136 (+) Transcript_13902:317-724(+)
MHFESAAQPTTTPAKKMNTRVTADRLSLIWAAVHDEKTAHGKIGQPTTTNIAAHARILKTKQGSGTLYTTGTCGSPSGIPRRGEYSVSRGTMVMQSGTGQTETQSVQPVQSSVMNGWWVSASKRIAWYPLSLHVM